jgi:antitoxin component YwqK of YwqJK toxin-antitoxin module
VIKPEGDYRNGTMIGIWKHYDKKGFILRDLDYSFKDIECNAIPRDSIENQFKQT